MLISYRGIDLFALLRLVDLLPDSLGISVLEFR